MADAMNTHLPPIDGRAFVVYVLRDRIRERELVPFDSAVVIQAKDKYLEVHVAGRAHPYLLGSSIATIAPFLGDSFLRIHRNCLVNRRYLRGWTRSADDPRPNGGYSAVVNAGEGPFPPLLVSRRYASELRLASEMRRAA